MTEAQSRDEEWRKTTIRGLSWSVIASVLKQVLSFIVGILMARLLSPVEFGLIGMVLFFAGLATLLVDQGMGAAIIQNKGLEARHLDSIFCLNIFFGVLVAGALSIASPLIASFYHEPILRPLTMWVSLNYLINSLSVVPNALMAKRMEFKRLAIIETIAVVISGSVGIFLALRGFGVWSLVWQMLS